MVLVLLVAFLDGLWFCGLGCFAGYLFGIVGCVGRIIVYIGFR